MALADYGAYPGWEDTQQFTSVSGAVPATPQTVPFTASCFRVVIQIIGGNGAHINFGGAAATTNYLIPAGGTFIYQGRPVGSVSILGANPAGGTYSIHGN
jgi:hypothetical protein